MTNTFVFDTYAIIEIQIERFHNPGYKSFGLINESDWKFQNVHFLLK